MKNYKQNPNKEGGKSVMQADKVTKYMATKLITFYPGDDIFEAIDTLLTHGISGAPVLNDKNEVIGMIDDKDCLRVLVDEKYYNQPSKSLICSRYMDNVFRSIQTDADIIDVANIFLTSTYKRLIVLDDNGKLAGQVSRQDILRAIKDMKGTTWHKKDQ